MHVHRDSDLPDMALLWIVLVLVCVGLIVVYSTSAYNGDIKFHDTFYYVKKQGFAVSIGLAVMYIVARTDYHLWKRFAVVAYGLSLLLSTAVLFVGAEYNGSKRWLMLGPVSFQPSEYGKIAMIVFLAWLIEKQSAKIRKIKVLILIMAAVFPLVAVIGMENLSTAIILLGIAVILVFVASPQYGRFFWLAGIGVGVMACFLSLESYRLERIAIWRNPEAYEKGYQTLQGLYAIGSGGVFGIGLGNSIQKLGFVPEAQNDMTFAIICEELGVVGAVAILILMGVLIWRLYVIAARAEDGFGMLLGSGIMAHMLIQVVLNVSVVTNTIPNTGITLPFISYGGTSLVFLLAEMGLAVNLSCHSYSGNRNKGRQERTHGQERDRNKRKRRERTHPEDTGAWETNGQD